MGIEIANLTGTLKTLAEIADESGNNNNVIDSASEKTVFENYAKAAVQSGQVTEADYKEIFGSEIKTGNKKTVTNPQTKAYTKDQVKRMEKYVTTILEEEFATTPEKLVKKLAERLGVNVNDPMYQDLQGQVKYILNAINEVGYNSKDDVEKLYDKVKEKLYIGRKDDYAKDVLKALVKNAEYNQATKELNELKQAYETLVNAGMDEEAAFDQLKAEYKDKGSYYHDYLKKRGSFFYKITHFKSKMSDFETSHIMPDARRTVREAVYESDSTSSKGVKQDAKATLEDNNDYNKYTKKALGGENNFKEWISGQDSDMKIARKNQARKNLVYDIREEGLTSEEVHDAVDKKKTFLFFKKKTQLFEALVSSGLIVDLGNGKYDVSPLSELIGIYVGSNYKLDRTSKDYKPLAEKTKTTSALAAATELKKLSEKEAQMLVKMCGYDVEGKDWGKAILGATVGALVGGLSGASAAATNTRYYYDTNLSNTNHVELNIMATGSQLDDLISQLGQVEGATLNLIEGGIQIIIDQENLVPLFWKGSKQILKTALKSAAITAAAGLIAGLKDEPEKPITSTQFKCVTLEEYAKFLDSEAEQKAIKPQYKKALMLIASTFVNEKDGSWDCEAYKNYLDHGYPEKGIYGAGSGSVLNREELIGLLEGLKRDDEVHGDDDGDDGDDGDTPVEDEHNYSTKDKNAIAAEYKDVPVIDGRTTSWTKIAGQYDCLIERYGLNDAIRMIKIAQGINNGDYSKENLEKLLALSKKGLSHMKNVEGLDYEAYKSALQATYLPALKKDNEGNNIPGTGVKVPVELAECTRDASKSLKAEASSNDGEVVDPTGHAADKIKVRDGQPARYYARFDGGAVQEYDSMQARDQAVADFKAKYPNAKVEKWKEE